MFYSFEIVLSIFSIAVICFKMIMNVFFALFFILAKQLSTKMLFRFKNMIVHS